VAEVHQAREELAARFKFDLRAYCRHLQVLEKTLTSTVVDFSKRSVSQNGPSSLPRVETAEISSDKK